MSRLIPVGRRRASVLQFLPMLLVGSTFLLAVGCGGGANAPKAARSGDGAGGMGAPGLNQPPNTNPKTDQDKGNSETYGTIVENPFRSPLVAPRSTFSADVNTASYSNVRRFITQGQLPPRDAVFLADMVNYFPYRYPEPAGDNPVSLTLDLAPCPWKPDHKLARIGVRARVLAPHETPRRNLVFLIDTSGSMDRTERLPLVKRSLELLVPQLTAADRVSIVTYAGDAGLKLPATPGDQQGRILDVVRSLTAGGGTHGSAGIQLAYETARRNYIDGGANRIIVCTDGDFNMGQTSESDLVQLIEKERASRVFLTVLGYGMGNLKNQMLEKLARHGNGHYAYIDTVDEAKKVFVEQGGALVCVAKDVKFQVEFNPAKVTAYRLIGYENRILKDEDYKDDAKDAGDIGSGHTVTALYEIVPAGVKIDLPGVDPLKYQTPPQPGTATDEWLMVKMRYKLPDGDASKELAAALPGAAGGSPMTEDFRFAAAVAEFGLILRDSPYKGSANLADVLTRAEGATGYDPEGHRKEFVELVRKVSDIKAKTK
jgi:Ca-activated chloride channel family protein